MQLDGRRAASSARRGAGASAVKRARSRAGAGDGRVRFGGPRAASARAVAARPQAVPSGLVAAGWAGGAPRSFVYPSHPSLLRPVPSEALQPRRRHASVCPLDLSRDRTRSSSTPSESHRMHSQSALNTSPLTFPRRDSPTVGGRALEAIVKHSPARHAVLTRDVTISRFDPPATGPAGSAPTGEARLPEESVPGEIRGAGLPRYKACRLVALKALMVHPDEVTRYYGDHGRRRNSVLCRLASIVPRSAGLFAAGGRPIGRTRQYLRQPAGARGTESTEGSYGSSPGGGVGTCTKG